MIHPLELLEPEDFVGNLWHDWASRLAAPPQGAAEVAVTLEEMRASVALLVITNLPALSLWLPSVFK